MKNHIFSIHFFFEKKQCCTQTNNYQFVIQLSTNCTELGPPQLDMAYNVTILYFLFTVLYFVIHVKRKPISFF